MGKKHSNNLNWCSEEGEKCFFFVVVVVCAEGGKSSVIRTLWIYAVSHTHRGILHHASSALLHSAATRLSNFPLWEIVAFVCECACGRVLAGPLRRRCLALGRGRRLHVLHLLLLFSVSGAVALCKKRC